MNTLNSVGESTHMIRPDSIDFLDVLAKCYCVEDEELQKVMRGGLASQ